MHPFLNIADRAARDAGRIILRSLERMVNFTYEAKIASDLINEVSQQAGTAIIAAIRKVYPQHQITLKGNKADSYDADLIWIVDPLSSITNFAHNFLHLAISIGIQYKERIEYGLIYDPIRQETFYASRGQGARQQHKRLRVSNQTRFTEALVGTECLSKNVPTLNRWISLIHWLSLQGGITRRTGCAPLDLAYVAAGRLDGFLGFDLPLWETAAGSIILQEAGGLSYDTNGKEASLETQDIICANPTLCKLLLTLNGFEKLGRRVSGGGVHRA